MNTFELGIWKECTKCTFYSVTFAKDDPELEISEVDKFLEYYEKEETLIDDLLRLHNHIVNDIGELHGALPVFFNRDENEVIALPFQGKKYIGGTLYYFPNFPLRLSAMRISDNLVILLNGGLKDAPQNQGSSHHTKWKETCAIAKRIEDAITSKEVIVDIKSKKLLNHLSEEGITL